MGRAVYALLARWVLPAALRERVGRDLLACHDQVMSRAAARGRAGAAWLREAQGLLLARREFRRGAPEVSGPTRRREDDGTVGSGGSPGGRPGSAVSRPGGKGAAWLADDLVHAWRSLVRRPAASFFIILVLAGGLGSSTAIYSAVRHTLLHPLPYPTADRMVALWRTLGTTGLITVDPEQAEVWGGQRDLVESTFQFGGTARTLTGRGEPEALYSVQISEGYFEALDLRPTLGRSFVPEELADDGSRSLMLGWGLWRSRFGSDPGVLGTTVTLDGETWTVVGVGPQNAPLPSGFPELPQFWLPLTPASRTSGAIAVLRPGVELETFQERIDSLVARANAAEPSRFGGKATRPQDMMGSRLRGSLTTLAVAVGLLLLIACLNVSALLVTRADRRRHETAVRVALGVGRARLVRQHLLESLILAALGGAAGVGVAALGVAAARALRPDRLAILDRAAVDGPVLAFGFAIALAAGMIFALLPAWQLASADALPSLTSSRGSREDRRSSRARWSLVVAEVALSFALLVGSALLVRTMMTLQAVDPGFEPAGVLVADLELPGWRYPEAADRDAAWREVITALERLQEVEAASAAGGVPSRSGVYFGTLEVEGREVPEETRNSPFFGSTADPAYFEVLRQPILEGRGFTATDLADGADVVVLGESTAAELWPDGDALGGRMRLGQDAWSTVVGITRDVPAHGLASDGPPPRQMYVPDADREATIALIRVRGDARAAIPAVMATLRATLPDAPLEVVDASSVLGESVAIQRFTMRLLSALAVLAAALASVGLYGVLSQTVGRRTREIGIRMALGARRGGIVWTVVRGAGVAVFVGVVTGAGLSFAGARLIESQLFGVESRDPLAFVGAALVLGIAALFAASVPALRATRVDPLRAIASE